MRRNKTHSSHASNEASRSRPATTKKAHRSRKSTNRATPQNKCGKPIRRRPNSKSRFCERRAVKVIFSSRKGWIGLCDQHATELRRLFPAAAGAIMTILP